MALVLSSDDQARLAATLEALLSPLASPTREDWYRRIVPELRRLLRGDPTVVVSQVEGIARHFRPDSPNLAAQLTAWSDIRGGESQLSDPEVDGKLIAQRRKRTPVLTSALLALVSPALRAGLEIMNRLELSRASLTTTLDALTDGVLVVGLAEGRELYRNRALIAMLTVEPERGRLEQRALQLARGLETRIESGAESKPPLPAVIGEVTTTHAHYLLRVSYLVPGSFSRGGAALVAIQAPVLTLPDTATLRARFRLTQREAEIALWLARGATDAELAHTLGISQHTVRHHAENVFVKLGVHSRKALALHLLR
jgi:DNA-binding CsgD family transcriptional regulator